MRRRFPIAVHLAVFGLAILLPPALAGAVVAWRLASDERARLERSAETYVGDLARDLDRELEVVTGGLRALATSPSMDSGQYEAIYAQARQFASQFGVVVLIRDATGQLHLNTAVPWGAPLPVTADPEALRSDRIALDTGRPHVSNLFTGTATGERYVMISLPVSVQGRSGFLLCASFTPESLRKAIDLASVPADWNASVVDDAFRIVARSRQQERFVGAAATPSFQASVTAGVSLWRGVTLEGQEVVSTARRLRLAPWWISVSVPTATLEAPMWQMMSGVAGVTGLGLAASLLLAFAYGRTLSGPVRAVARTAATLPDDDGAAPPDSAIAEVQDIAVALMNAREELGRRAGERDAALRAAEAGERRLRATYENAGVGIAEIDRDGRFASVNDAICTITGYSREEMLARRITDMSAPEEVAQDAALFDQQREGAQGSYVVEKLFRRKDGERRWVRLFSTAVEDTAGFAYSVRVVLDVTEERRAAEHQKLLIAELNHRVKNTLAVVQSLVMQTIKATPSPAAFRDALTGRIMALARSHDLLSESEWKGATLDTLMRTTLKAYDAPDWSRVMLEGPPIRVGPRAVVSLSLTAHELATNAAKYGALSSPQGRLEVRWGQSEEGPSVLLEWIETTPAGGAEPGQGRPGGGFGSRLVRLSIEKELDGRYETSLDGGFRLRATIPRNALDR